MVSEWVAAAAMPALRTSAIGAEPNGGSWRIVLKKAA
jgi:hypothetical protein